MNLRSWRRFAAVALLLITTRAGIHGATVVEPEDSLGRRWPLTAGWLLKSSVLVKEDGGAISQAGFHSADWYPVQIPSTVLSVLVKHGVYPDPRLGLNVYQIPDSSDEFNRDRGLAQYSYLPGQRNPWRDPYWYRTEVVLQSLDPDRRVWLHFDAINYRAEVWLNGVRVADPQRMAGMFQRFEFDVTDRIKPGANGLAVKIFPVDHPGKPETQLAALGPDRAYVGKAIMRDVTEIMTIGYDCMMTVPDRNMGIWQDVWIEVTGPVAIRNPFVATELPLPLTNRATLSVSTELVNATDRPIQGVLMGRVSGTPVQFAQAVRLNPHEVRVVGVDPKPVLDQPRLWWPAQCGEQHLYDLELTFQETNPGETVAQPHRPALEHVSFGVRQVGFEMHEVDGAHGRRLLVNGQKIFCRGGYIQPELLLDWDAARMETEIRYFTQANLNLVYFEDIPNPPRPFLELCDRYGLLFGNCFYSCYWLRPGTPYPDDPDLLERCTVDLLKRYRNHPSLILYMAMNESDTKEPVYQMWHRQVLALDGTRWFIPSASFPDSRKDAPSWIQKDLPAGMTDIGASYSWAEPVQYFRWVREDRKWMFMMEGGSASVPPMSSLTRFIPNTNGTRTPFALDSVWAHHGANQYLKGYDQALRRLHGEPESMADYCWKGHLLAADQHRSFFEAVNHRLWDITSGATQWKINSCEPSVQWQIFDWYHKPMASYFYIRKACEPLHVQLNLPDHQVSVINTQRRDEPDLQVTARVFDLDSRLLSKQSARLSVPANSYREAFAATNVITDSELTFVSLELTDQQGQLRSDNLYWLAAPKADGLKSLQRLPMVRLEKKFHTQQRGSTRLVDAEVTNPTDRIAFFVQVAATSKRSGAELLPVFWSDNYFCLLPHQSRSLTAELNPYGANAADVALQLGGWNIETDFQCASLTTAMVKGASPRERLIVTASITNTFLDGSRVTLFLDDKPAAAKWAWAAPGTVELLEFDLGPLPPGQHLIQADQKTATIQVR
jgi:hypothetical protein